MRAIAFIPLLLFSPSLFAQGFPQPKPGAAHKIFAHDAGTWDCEVKMYMAGPEGPPVTFKGVEKNELVSGDLYLLSEFKAKMGEQDFEGRALMGYNPKSKKYEGTWADSFTSAPSQMTGEFDDESRVMTLLCKVQDESGEEMLQKQVTKYHDDDTKTFTLYLVVDEGGKTSDLKVMEMTAKKRK